MFISFSYDADEESKMPAVDQSPGPDMAN